jgi:hypothetical protein
MFCSAILYPNAKTCCSVRIRKQEKAKIHSLRIAKFRGKTRNEDNGEEMLKEFEVQK